MMDEHDRLEAQYDAAKARKLAQGQAELLDALERALGLLDEHEICCPERDRCQAVADKASALAAATGTAKTAKRVECEASQSGPNASEGNTQGTSHDH